MLTVTRALNFIANTDSLAVLVPVVIFLTSSLVGKILKGDIAE